MPRPSPPADPHPTLGEGGRGHQNRNISAAEHKAHEQTTSSLPDSVGIHRVLVLLLLVEHDVRDPIEDRRPPRTPSERDNIVAVSTSAMKTNTARVVGRHGAGGI